MEFLAWPAVVLILGTIALLLFRQPLIRLIDRASKIGKGGIEAVSTAQEAGIEVKPSPADELMKAFDNALLLQREKIIRDELDRLKGTSASERERILIRFLAASNLAMAFDRLYSLIWGSQIGVLQFLNTGAPEVADVGRLNVWYEQAAARDPDVYKAYSFDQWLGFLQVAGLLRRDGERVEITLEGREFLKYLVQQGYPLYKAL